MWMRSPVGAIVAVILGTGCYGPTTRLVDDEHLTSRLPFIRDGRTTRAEVRRELGSPAREYRSGAVLAYRLTRRVSGERNELRVVPLKVSPFDRPFPAWGDAELSLVLEFDAQGVLARHSLVQVANYMVKP